MSSFCKVYRIINLPRRHIFIQSGVSTQVIRHMNNNIPILEISESTLLRTASAISDLSKIEDGEFKDKLCSLKNRFTNDMNSLHHITTLFFEAWDLLSSKDAKDHLRFQLPLNYRSQEVKYVIQSVLCAVYAQLSYFKRTRREGVNTGYSILLSGPVGVGKTTILVCLHALLILFLSEYVVSVYHEYKGLQFETLPHELVLRAMERDGIKTDEHCLHSLDHTVAYLYRRNKMLVFFGDEIQLLYTHDTNNNTRDIVRQIARIGKATGHIGVCTGSTIDTISWAHFPNQSGFEGYITLNHSVYSEIQLEPIRDKVEFTQLYSYLTNSDKTRSADDETITNRSKWFFLYSGGFGKHFGVGAGNTTDQLIASCRTILIPDQYFDTTDLTLRKILDEMMLNVIDYIKTNTFDPWTHSHAISRTRANALHQLYSSGPAESESASGIEKYIDESILLYRGHNVELVRPGLLIALYTRYPGTYEGDRYAELAFEGTLTGRGHTLDERTSSAGHKIELPLLHMLCKIDSYRYQIATEALLSLAGSWLSAVDYCDRWVLCDGAFPGIEAFLMKGCPLRESTNTCSKNRASKIYEMTVVQFEIGRVVGGSTLTVRDVSNTINSAKQGYLTLLSKFENSNNTKLAKIVYVTTKPMKPEAVTYLTSGENAALVELYDCNYVLDNVSIIGEAARARLKEWLATNG